MRRVPGATDRVVVVGAGLAGLSAALHLRGAGREVVVVERETVPGGRNGLLELEGYRFDTGPTVLTMPDLIQSTLDPVGDNGELFYVSAADGCVHHLVGAKGWADAVLSTDSVGPLKQMIAWPVDAEGHFVVHAITSGFLLGVDPRAAPHRIEGVVVQALGHVQRVEDEHRPAALLAQSRGRLDQFGLGGGDHRGAGGVDDARD